MPAPSPARGSAPTAPRCSRLSRMVSASSTILCDLRPLISAINPTPQESFSSAGSNRPKPDALIVVLALPAGAPRFAAAPAQSTPRRFAFPCAPGRSTHSGGNLRAAQRPVAAFSPPSDAPLPYRRLTPALPLLPSLLKGARREVAARNAGHQ